MGVACCACGVTEHRCGTEAAGKRLLLLHGCGADARTDRCLCKTLPQFGGSEEGDAVC